MSTYETISRTYDETTDIDVANISTICEQRRLKMLFNMPPTRFTPVSPYTYNTNGQLQFTKRQLDMRRKVEILKHDKSSTQGNRPTKKEQWAHMNSRKYSIRKTVGNLVSLDGATVASSVDCSTVATSSKKADVPGPAVELQLDKSVPLYNYGAPTRTYGNLDESNDAMFEVSANGDNKTYYDNVYGFFAFLKIMNTIDETSKNFTIKMPFSLGYSKNTGVSAATNITGTISVKTPTENTTKLYFSGVETNSGTHSYSVDISSAFFSSSPNETVETVAGTITISNIFVDTQPDYFYELAQVFDLETDLSLSLVTPCLKINMNSVEFSTE